MAEKHSSGSKTPEKKKKYVAPVLTRYERLTSSTRESVYLEGTANIANCSLGNCSGPPPINKFC